MKLSDEALDEFIAIYLREFGETISRDEAMTIARRLVNLYRQFLGAPSAVGRGVDSHDSQAP